MTVAELVARPARPPIATKQSHYNIRVPLRGRRELLFNSVSQRLALLEADEAAWLDSVPDGGERPQNRALKIFADAGFIVRADHVERGDVEKAFAAKRNDPRRLSITIATTLGCNLACTYCFQGHDKPSGHMSQAVEAQVVALAQAHLPRLRHLSLCWYGGEPLMNTGTIWRLSETLMRMTAEANVGFGASIITNGHLLTPEIADRLTACKVGVAQITIDGTAPAHDVKRPLLSGRGSYDRIVANIANVLARSKLRMTVRINVDVENAENIEALLDEFVARGFAANPRFGVYFAPIEAITSDCSDCEDDNFGKVDYARLEVRLLEKALRLGLTHIGDFPRHMGICQAVRPNDVVVLPSGDLHKCWDTVQDSRKRVGALGQADAALDDADWMAWSPYKSPVCSDCKILPICGGGCAFKSVHAEETAGEQAMLPCPSLKFNLAERLFLAARRSGLVSEADWDPDRSPTWTSQGSKVGRRHSNKSVRGLSARLRADALAERMRTLSLDAEAVPGQ